MTGRLAGALTLMTLIAIGCGGEDPMMGDLDAPTVDALDSPTSETMIHLSGSALGGATIEVRGGANALDTGMADAGGTFDVEVTLSPDSENMLLVTQSLDGAESGVARVTVIHDGTAPSAPMLDATPSPTRRETLTITGTSEAGATLRITGGANEMEETTVGSDGSFSIDVALETQLAAITQNDLVAVAIDAAGNESAPTARTVVHNPTLPLEAPTLAMATSPTNMTALTLSGTAEPNLAIGASGASAAVSGTSDAEGAFSLALELRPNQANTIRVTASNPELGIVSAEAIVVIEHDDIAPAAPTLDALPGTTSLSTISVTGMAEAGSTVMIMGGAADAMGSADEDGRFDIDVTLTTDTQNDLVAMSTDAAGNTSESAEASIVHDASLPTPVTVDPVVSPTAMASVMLSGTTEAEAEVVITGGAAEARVTAAGDGSWMVSVMLTANARNELHVARTGAETETVVVIVHDDRAPASPTLDALASPTNQTDIAVTGSTEPSARVSITGGMATVNGSADGSGRFSLAVQIAEDSESTLMVVATDAAGNTSDASMVSVTHSSDVPDAPVLDEPAPAPTSDATLRITGTITTPGEGIMILVRGGAADAMVASDPDTGAFDLEVTLQANATNALMVVSREGEIESPAALVTVIHDDVAPSAPDAAQISVGTPGGLGCTIRGSTNVTGAMMAVEGLARVEVANFTASASPVATSAADDGSFSTAVRACGGDLLRVVAIDAAGNTSGTTEITVE